MKKIFSLVTLVGVFLLMSFSFISGAGCWQIANSAYDLEIEEGSPEEDALETWNWAYSECHKDRNAAIVSP